MKRVMVTAALVALLGLAVSAPAAEQDENVRAYGLDPVTISAGKPKARSRAGKEEPAYSQFAVPESSKAATEVFTAEEIEEMHPRDVFDVLEYGAGVDVSFQGRKALNFVGIRAGDNLGVILDGVYLPWSQASRILAGFPTDAIEEVRIIRDSTVLTVGPLTQLTSLQGSPNQGFIVIKTKRAKKFENGIVASYGSLDTYKTHAYHGGKVNEFDYRLAYTYQNTDGKTGWYNGSNSSSALFRGGYTGETFNLDAFIYYSGGLREFQRSTPINTQTYDQMWKYDPLKSIMAALHLANRWTKGQTTSLTYSYSAVNDDMVSSTFSKPHISKATPQRDYVQNIDLRHVSEIGKNTLKAGATAVLWETPTGQFSYEGKKREEDLYGFFIHDEQRLLNDSFSIDGGFRLDMRYIGTGIDKFKVSDSKTQIITDEWAKNAYTGAVGAAYKINPVWTASARFSYSYQPTDAFLVTLDDKELPAEERFKYEAGVTANLHPAFNPALTFFYYDINGAKVSAGTVTVGKDTVTMYDGKDVARRGLEFGFNGSILDSLSYQLMYSYVESDDDQDNRNMAHNLFNIRLQHRYGNFETNFMVKYMGDYEGTASFGTTPVICSLGDYTRVDANINYDFKFGGTAARVTLYGQNLTNEHFETKVGWEDTGLTYGAQLSLKF